MSELTIRLYEDSQDNIESLYYQSASEIDRLKAELEEATKQKSDWHNMYQETYDELSSVQQAILVETERIKAAWREIAILERQLAEAKAEVERFKYMAQQNSTEMCEWMEKYNKLVVPIERYNQMLNDEIMEHHFKEHHTPDYVKIEELENELAEARAEVERLSALTGEWCKTAEMYRRFETKTSKQTAREIVEMLRGAPNGFYIANMIKRCYGLEG